MADIIEFPKTSGFETTDEQSGAKFQQMAGRLITVASEQTLGDTRSQSRREKTIPDFTGSQLTFEFYNYGNENVPLVGDPIAVIRRSTPAPNNLVRFDQQHEIGIHFFNEFLITRNRDDGHTVSQATYDSLNQLGRSQPASEEIVEELLAYIAKLVEEEKARISAQVGQIAVRNY